METGSFLFRVPTIRIIVFPAYGSFWVQGSYRICIWFRQSHVEEKCNMKLKLGCDRGSQGVHGAQAR